MEIIKKKISLDSIKTFNNSKVPAYFNGSYVANDNDAYSSWGGIPIDFRFTNDDGTPVKYTTLINDGHSNGYYEALSGLSKTFPFSDSNLYVSTESGSTSGMTVVGTNVVLRYKTLEENFYFLKNFIEKLRFYTLCERKGVKKWVEYVKGKDFNDIFEYYFSFLNRDRLTFIDKLPLVEDINYCNAVQFQNICNHTEKLSMGDMYAVVDKNGLLYNRKFQAWSGRVWTRFVCVAENIDDLYAKFIVNGLHYEERFYRFCKFMFDNAMSQENELSIASIPFVNIPVLLTEEYNSIGLLTPHVSEWIEKKKYYIGDKVIYSTSADTLGSVYVLKNATDFENVEISESVYNALKNCPSGDETQLFTELDSNSIPHFYKREYYYNGYYNAKTKLTEFDEPNNQHWFIDAERIDGSTSTLTATESVSESRLTELERYKKSYDESGNVLPFNAINGSFNTEMRYILGNTKVKYNDAGYFYCNVLNSISFMDANTPESSTITTFALNNSPVISAMTSEAYYGIKDKAISFSIGSDYTDGKTHYFRIPSSVLSNITSLNSVAFNDNSVPVTIKYESFSDYISVDSLTTSKGSEVIIKLAYSNSAITDAGNSYVYKFSPTATGVTANVCRGILPITPNVSARTGLDYVVTKNNSLITFDYTIDKIMNVNGDTKAYETASGVNFKESHKYSNDEYICNYEGMYCWIEVTDTETTEYPIVNISAMPDITLCSASIVYHYLGDTISRKTDTTTVSVFVQGHYYRKTSVFNYVNIDFERTYQYTKESGVTVVGNNVAQVDYKNNQLYGEFQNVEGFADDSIIGIQDFTKDIDAYIDRNGNASASFERHNILSEVNTFQDLENYKNNYFNL